MAENITAYHSIDGVPSFSAEKISVSKLTVNTGLKCIAFALNKSEKCFFANNSPKKIWRPKVWNMIHHEPVVVFLQK